MYASPKRSALFSGLLHAAGIVLVLVATNVAPQVMPRYQMVPIAGRDISPYVPVFRNSTGGGGGGGGELTRASKGELPKRATRQFVPPTTHILNDNPRLAMEATILGPPDVTMPTPAVIGLPNGIIGMPSNGLGKGGGIGDTGKGGGVGNKEGPGAGDGDGIGITGLNPSRGAITAAILEWKAEPDYSEEARKAKLQGTVVLQIVVDTSGRAANIRIVRTLGLGLDEKAVEAVAKWRFRPARQNGKAVAQPAVVEVTFRLL